MAGNITVTLHVDVKKVALSEEVRVLEEVVLGETLLHEHAVTSFKFLIGHLGRESQLFLAELDSTTQLINKITFSHGFIVHLLSKTHFSINKI